MIQFLLVVLLDKMEVHGGNVSQNLQLFQSCCKVISGYKVKHMQTFFCCISGEEGIGPNIEHVIKTRFYERQQNTATDSMTSSILPLSSSSSQDVTSHLQILSLIPLAEFPRLPVSFHSFRHLSFAFCSHAQYNQLYAQKLSLLYLPIHLICLQTLHGPAKCILLSIS